MTPITKLTKLPKAILRIVYRAAVACGNRAMSIYLSLRPLTPSEEKVTYVALVLVWVFAICLNFAP